MTPKAFFLPPILYSQFSIPLAPTSKTKGCELNTHSPLYKDFADVQN